MKDLLENMFSLDGKVTFGGSNEGFVGKYVFP